ncbi:hypothetical protein NMY22_g5335 [Coprinellus aureogranulatus]|nr:hypothetical protein NMY22_g5335 [Coprinellus aureogranulatus]
MVRSKGIQNIRSLRPRLPRNEGHVKPMAEDVCCCTPSVDEGHALLTSCVKCRAAGSSIVCLKCDRAHSILDLTKEEDGCIPSHAAYPILDLTKEEEVCECDNEDEQDVENLTSRLIMGDVDTDDDDMDWEEVSSEASSYDSDFDFDSEATEDDE